MAINTHLSWKNSGLLVDLFQLWLAWYWLAIYSAIFFAKTRPFFEMVWLFGFLAEL
jgi:hypothetical protein